MDVAACGAYEIHESLRIGRRPAAVQIGLREDRREVARQLVLVLGRRQFVHLTLSGGRLNTRNKSLHRRSSGTLLARLIVDLP